jgi:hypothetical protein
MPMLAIPENEEREKKRKSSNANQPRFIYTLFATLESSLVLQFTIRIFVYDLTQRQQFSYQDNHATTSDVATLPSMS